MTTRYSIIIPTVDRKQEFLSALATVTCESYSNLEIFIQDNASNWGLADVVSKLNDSRIRINRSEIRLDMASNWDQAISRAAGDFIFILGDDDGWYKGSLGLIDSIIDKYPDIELVSWVRDDYGWPSAPPCIANRLIINWSPRYQLVDSQKLLERVMAGSLSHESLPKIYSGFHKKNLLEKYKIHYNNLFVDNYNPDISSGLQALHLTRSFVYIHQPLSIIGTSQGGGGWRMVNPIQYDYQGQQGKPIDNHLNNLSIIASNPDLSILITYTIFCVAAGLESPCPDRHILGYVCSLPLDLRKQVVNYLEAFNNINISNETMSRIQRILSLGDKWIQPALRLPAEEDLLSSSPGTIKCNLSVAKYGIQDIKSASELGLLIRNISKLKTS